MKTKIAVYIHGGSKNLNLTIPLFKHYNNLYPDVEFDFYFSLWETDIKYDLSWSKAYEFIKESECPYDLNKHPEGRHQPHYTYTLYRVNELRKKSNIDYTGILHLRSDLIVLKDLIDYLVNLHRLSRKGRQNPQLSDSIIYSADGSKLHHGSLWTDDLWFYSTPTAYDIFSNMFWDIFIHKTFTCDILMHVFQAEYLNANSIYNRAAIEKNQIFLIREPYRFGPADSHTNAGWAPKHPSTVQIQRLLGTHPVEWFFRLDNYKELRNIFETTPKS